MRKGRRNRHEEPRLLHLITPPHNRGEGRGRDMKRPSSLLHAAARCDTNESERRPRLCYYPFVFPGAVPGRRIHGRFTDQDRKGNYDETAEDAELWCCVEDAGPE